MSSEYPIWMSRYGVMLGCGSQVRILLVSINFWELQPRDFALFRWCRMSVRSLLLIEILTFKIGSNKQVKFSNSNFEALCHGLSAISGMCVSITSFTSPCSSNIHPSNTEIYLFLQVGNPLHFQAVTLLLIAC